jgi:hypothetical protein
VGRRFQGPPSYSVGKGESSRVLEPDSDVTGKISLALVHSANSLMRGKRVKDKIQEETEVVRQQKNSWIVTGQ